jgi:hypothetical protein
MSTDLSTSETTISTPKVPPEESNSSPPATKQISLKEVLQSLSSEVNDTKIDLNNLDLDALEAQGNVLTQKAFFLLGLANEISSENKTEGEDVDDNGLLSEEDIQKTKNLVDLLQQDGQSLLSYAILIKSNIKNKIQTDQETLDTIQKLQDGFGKYDEQTNALITQTKGIFKSAVTSEECSRLLANGKEVLQVWIDKRNLLLAKALDGRNDEVLKQIEDKLGSLITYQGDLVEIINDLRVDVVVFLNHVDRHKETILQAADEIKDVLEEKDQDGKMLQDDEDIKFLIEKVKEKVGKVEKSIETLQNDGTVEEGSAQASNLLVELEKSDLLKKAIVRGTQFLENNKDELDPEKFLQNFQDGPNGENNQKKNIDKFLKLIKNEALEFLLQYLPTVKIPPLEHDDENCTYSLNNIDLSKFHLLSENVDVDLIDDGVFICATKIQCEMDNLAFKYKSKSFPYPGTSGVAYAKATGISVAMELRLEVSDDQLVSSGMKCAVEVVNDDNNVGNNVEGGNKDEVKPDLEKPHTPTPSPVQITDKSAHSPPQSPSSPLDEVNDKTVSQKVMNKIAQKLDQQYKLVLFHHASYGVLKIGELHMELREFFLKSLANFLLNLFQTQVQAYIEKTINNVILKQSEVLLHSINDKVAKYLPIIAKVIKKVEHKAPLIEQIVAKAAKNIKDEVKKDRSEQPNTANVALDLPVDKLGLKKE